MLVREGIEGKVIISAVVRPIHHLKKEAPRDTLPTIRRHDTPFGAIERPLVLAIANLKSGGRARYGSEEDHQILACERIDDAILLEDAHVHARNDGKLPARELFDGDVEDRKSTRLNSSHVAI